MGGDLREFGNRQFVTLAEDDSAEHGVFQLADIARPVVARDQRHGFRPDAANGAAFLCRETRQKPPGEIGDIIAALAQGRDGDGEDVEAIVEVFAEAALLHKFDQVLVGGGDDADIDLDGFLATDGIDLAFLDGAQQLYLCIERQFADLIQEQRAVIGLDEFADVAVHRAGEGAFLVAKEDAFD